MREEAKDRGPVAPGMLARNRAGTPGFLTHNLSTSMSNYNLVYAISKRTPPSPKALKAILDVQAELNRRCTWSHERLALDLVERPAVRAPFSMPLFRFTLGRPMFAPLGERAEVSVATTVIPDAAAAGATKVRDNLWNAHLVVAFLKHVSREHDLHVELRDDGGFVLPGAVSIQNGKVELQREWLNRERERVLETTGDPNTAAPFVWVEAEALQGRFFLDASASDYAQIPEFRELDARWEQLEAMTLQDVAELVVDHVASSPAPVIV